MATTTGKARKERKPIFGDSPINIGGGGGRRKGRSRSPFYVEVIFNHGVYIQGPSGSFINKNLVLDSVEINGQAPQTATLPHTPVPVSETSEIVVTYKKGLRSPTISINEGPFGVDFDTGHLPYDFDLAKHYAQGLKLTEVTIDGTKIDIRRGAGDANTIVAHTKDKPPKRKKR